MRRIVRYKPKILNCVGVCLFTVCIKCVARDPVCRGWRFGARATLESVMRREHVVGVLSTCSGLTLLGSDVSGLSAVARIERESERIKGEPRAPLQSCRGQ
jgi:hypothetical protein